jgi:hypothetical protein
MNYYIDQAKRFEAISKMIKDSGTVLIFPNQYVRAKTPGQKKLLQYVNDAFVKKWGFTYTQWISNSPKFIASFSSAQSLEAKVNEFLRDIGWTRIYSQWYKIQYAYYDPKKDRWKIRYKRLYSFGRYNKDAMAAIADLMFPNISLKKKFVGNQLFVKAP